ncbi:acyl-CoA dehydrogenase family protein [Rhodococcus opacus]|uniref:acyl-CoA dehydrogenase family protein n=1 Tax=Rhodococcus opacus TaxID=37919 RepID=UPI001C46FB17|nr:acyl-CoA dehydrogenase family protein [Rhodococcus opacus]MBV6760442.1 hypothetical protein [Rhodococcus opacus]
MTTLSEPPALLDRPTILASLDGLADELIAGGVTSDRENTDPTRNLELIAATGAQAVNVPERLGGLWNGVPFGGWSDSLAILTRISSFDGATGQNWGTCALVLRELLADDVPLPDETKAEIARRVLDENLRLVASNSETGSPAPVVARRIDGGVLLSGVKTFNTNSGGAGIASVGCAMEGEDARYHVLVDLTDPNVTLHRDWDVIGQRGTYSQTVTYNDVFVADGWFYAAHPISPLLASGVMMLHSALMLGIGQGALHATVDYLRTTNRRILPTADGAAADPLVTAKLGSVSIALHAAEALLEKGAHQLESAAGNPNAGIEELRVASINGFRAKVACVESSLLAAAEVIEFTGARGTAGKYGLDRFWRNARTFASHDPTELKKTTVGAYELTGSMPGEDQLLRV